MKEKKYFWFFVSNLFATPAQVFCSLYSLSDLASNFFACFCLGATPSGVVTSDSVFKNYSWRYSANHIGCWKSNTGQLMQGKHPAHCTMAPAPGILILILISELIFPTAGHPYFLHVSPQLLQSPICTALTVQHVTPAVCLWTLWS